LGEFEASQLLFVDESAANERTADRKYGWAPLGVTPHVIQPLKRSERWSILPVYSAAGFMDWEIVQGSFTAELFNKFVAEKVLPLATPYPGPRSVLVMDNAAIHHSDELAEMCAAAGVRLEYLPPYSPDFNPIEEAFAELKAWMKRYYELQNQYETMEGFLNRALTENLGKAGNHFRSCFIPIDEELE
jgi:transposase